MTVEEISNEIRDLCNTLLDFVDESFSSYSLCFTKNDYFNMEKKINIQSNIEGIDNIINKTSFDYIRGYLFTNQFLYKQAIQEFRDKKEIFMFGNVLKEAEKNFLPEGFFLYKPVITTGDGNCLYNAVSQCLFGDESKQNIIRSCHLFIIFEYEDYFREIYKRYQICNKNSFEEFIVQNARMNEWACEFNIIAVALLIDRPINIYNDYNYNFVMWPFNLLNLKNPICIGLKNNHFYGLVPRT